MSKNPTRAQAIKAILDARTHPDLAAMYHAGMEVQVNVGKDGGDRAGDYHGHRGQSYTDGILTWYPFRIPKNAFSEPEDNSGMEMTYPLGEHAEGIGMTGWCFSDRRSYWFGFDFDAIVGHAERHRKKLTDAELAEVRTRAENIPWVTVRRSTGGSGLHLYVKLAVPEPTKNHTEHAALGRAILSMMSALAGCDFEAKVDACGGNMWVWHRKMTKENRGLTLIKQGIDLSEVPKDWRSHVKVVRGERKKSLPYFVEEQGSEDAERIFDELSGQYPRTKLDDEHRKLITWLQEHQGYGWWNSDHHMLVTHTHHLARAHAELGMRGLFQTNSPATEPDIQNCFSGETEVITKTGPQRLRDLVGRTDFELMVRDERGNPLWKQCEVRSFGTQTTFPVVFGDGHVVFATKEHAWLYQDTNTKTVDFFRRKYTSELDDKIVLPKIAVDGTTARVQWSLPRTEEVFCAVVPWYRNFTLANGVVTGNCFAYPIRNGGWAVRRYTPGVSEAPTWEQDNKGYTKCYLNRDPDLGSASRAKGGVELEQGAFAFREAETANDVIKQLGAPADDLPPAVRTRPARLKPHKDGKRIVFEIDHQPHDDPRSMNGWFPEKGKWRRVFASNLSPAETEVGLFDDVVRHAVTESRMDGGWFIRVDQHWNHEPKAHVQLALLSLGRKKAEVDALMGASVLKPWIIVNRPFEEEYPGDRLWNRSLAKFRYPRSDDIGEYPHWNMILEHCGAGLDSVLASNGWALANEIKSGKEYLKLWLASVFQNPYEPLPYLFFYGNQNCGKSIFHEMIDLLITAGIVEANNALQDKERFNGELEGAVICVIEEMNLKKNKQAYERIKNWVTSPKLMIHRKNLTPYMMPNTTHWVHMANDHEACPIFPGDTRITMICVPDLQPGKMIPKIELKELLRKEAPHFLNALLTIDIPPSNDRLRVPVVTTSEKESLAKANQSSLEEFIEGFIHYVPGSLMLFSEFYHKFYEWLPEHEKKQWYKTQVSRSLPLHFPVGKRGGNATIGNISWQPGTAGKKLVLKDGLLVES